MNQICETAGRSALQRVVQAAASLLVMSCSSVAWAQVGEAAEASYPDRPIRLIAQFPPGSATDIVARTVGQKLTGAWGQQVVVDNRPGAGGRIGTELGARATPDGYTLTMSVAGPMSVAPALYQNLSYNVLHDFALVTNFSTQAQVLIANPRIPVQGVRELVTYARSHPGKVNYVSIGPGSFTHLAMELFQSVTKVKFNHIPFKAGSAAHVDLMSGQVQLMVDSLPSALSLIKTGKIRGIAVTSLERQKLAPELPTIAESGYPRFEAVGWLGVAAPANTPVAILDKLNRELVRIADAADTRQRFQLLGFNLRVISRAEYPAFVRAEIDKWTRVVREAGVRVES